MRRLICHLSCILRAWCGLGICCGWEHAETKLSDRLSGDGTNLLNVLICSQQLHREGLHVALELFNQFSLWVVIFNGAISDQGSLRCVCKSHIVFFEKLVTGV